MRGLLTSPCSFVLLPFFLAILLVRSKCAISSFEFDKQTTNLTDEMIEKYLDTINKPAVMTFENSDGDIIDCIDIRKQYAFDHPLLKNHELQLFPSEMPRMMSANSSNNTIEEEVVIGDEEAWYQNMTSCPEGTVPIMRIKVEDVLRAGTVSDFGRKQPEIALARHDGTPEVSRFGHEYAVAYSIPGKPVYGTTAGINMWNPSVQSDFEFSLSQIWVVAGDGSEENTIEAGWQVNPMLYGDRKTRFFIYWTADGYESTGCYNTRCPGFVQVNNKLHVGMPFAPVSTISGKQYEIILTIFKDRKTGNWWLSLGHNNAVGYWPAKLFTHLAPSAEYVEWGGEVINYRPDGAHTSTQMGSGRFANEGPGKASYFRSLGLVDSASGISPPQTITAQFDDKNCYSVAVPKFNEWGVHFYYGGPGRNPKCP